MFSEFSKKPTRTPYHYYNNGGIISKVSENMTSKTLKISVVDHLSVV